MNVKGPVSSDDLAVERTVMAADRTLMAWTRTALSLISFGFTIYKFLQFELQKGVAVTLKAEGPRRFGMAMIGMGVAFLLLASVQFWKEVKLLHPGVRWAPWRLSFFLAIALSLIGLLALVNVIWKVGPF